MQLNRSVLIVEDEEVIRTSLAEYLNSEGYETMQASTVAKALELARSRDFNVAVCDVQLPDGDGIELLRRLQNIKPSIFVLIITAYATVENTISAFKAGAFDYLVKPVIFDDLSHKLNRLFEYQKIFYENQILRRELARGPGMEEIVGSSKTLQNLQSTIRKIAATNSNVLLFGESGTGKELFARSIHSNGPNREQRFLAVNCGMRPIELLESQLFGSVGNSSQYPQAEQTGVFKNADGGSVYLDEISQLPMGTQGKLLRAIEYGEILPLGSAEPVKVDFRLIASTTQDLSEIVKNGEFEEDLFYRLDGMKIHIPALRERVDDVPELVEYFITKHSRKMGKRVTGATSETIRTLMSAEWKGNVRQLDNAIERAVMMCDDTLICLNDLPPELHQKEPPLPDVDDLRLALRHYERMHITRVLKDSTDKREAAKRLKLGLSSLYRKIEELDIELE
ncbi:MAG: sigma-54 dependent transcriptional regulator [Planctomycetes bacterium]|nr:sigma-54 dependent transcriptional regulator [Planctomycetota bacterium]MCH9726884.1 sigma-54 dependent transcriptional regulator [Planctomycetota bacterium]MCH9775568.1 sigma-54 dependent transcriptional regulator [Planctomycetota bacterium]MDF1744368.1 sigma-54 dependent transcriptional regulator [Gimesia sp.]